MNFSLVGAGAGLPGGAVLGGDRGDRGDRWGDRPPRRERPRFGDDAPIAAIVPGEEE